MDTTPLFPTASTDTAGALLRDFFACKLFDSAMDVVATYSVAELAVLAVATGQTPNANGTYSFEFDKMFSYKAYQLADAMLEVRNLLTSQNT